MLWTTDEEIGSESSRAAIEDEARRSRAVLVLEPSLPGGAVKTVAEGLRFLSADGSRRRRARGDRAAEGRQRRAGAGASDSARQRAAGSRRAASRSTWFRCPAGSGPTSFPTRRARSWTCACRRLLPPLRSTPRFAAFGRWTAAPGRGHRRHRSAAAGTDGPGRASVQASEGRRPRARSGSGRRRHRRRVGRQFHRGTRHSDAGRIGRGRRRRARAPRTRRHREPGRSAGLVAGLIARLA